MNDHRDLPQPVTDATQPVSGKRRLFVQTMALSVPALSSLLAGCGGASAATSGPVAAATPVAIGNTPYSVAIVAKEASAAFDITAGIDRMIALMREARSSGARMIVFGELWLPGYPVALNFQTDWAATSWPHYVANSITVGGPHWQRIVDAARTAGIYVSFGFSEIDSGYAYMAQALLGDDGALLYKRRKIRPSGSERNYWSDAPMAPNLQAVTTSLGRITMLECWEHLRPQSTFNIMAQLPNVHICAWPYMPAATANAQSWEREEVAHTAAAYFSQLTGAYTLLPGVGRVAVYRNSVKLADLAGNAAASMLYFTITPDNWSGATGSATSEFSYGVAALLAENYPGEKVADTEHANLKLNRLP